MKRFLFQVVVCVLLLPGAASLGADLDFYRDIYPFLEENCVSCHNKTTTKAGLNMETPELMIEGGDSGPSIVPGKSDESLLVEASVHSDFIEMPPPKNKTGARSLSEKEIAKLRQWIDEGAKSSTREVRQVAWQALSAEVDPIYAVAMSEDGRYAACGRGNRLFLYDLAERRRVAEIKEGREDGAHRALVQSLAFSPDGTRLASGSFREVKLWKRVETPVHSREGDPALDIVASMPFPDGKKIAAVSESGALLLIDVTTGQVVREIEKAHSGEPPHLAVSPDGMAVALLATKWNLRIWSVAHGKWIVEQSSPDPQQVVKHQDAAAKHQAAVQRLAGAEAALARATEAKEREATALARRRSELGEAPDEAGQKEIAALEVKLAAATKEVGLARSARDAVRSDTAATKKVADEEAAQAAAARKLEGTAIAWSRDGKTLFTADSGNVLRAWTLPLSGKALPAPRVLTGAKGAITSIAPGPGDRVVTGGADNLVRIWSASEGKIVREFAAAAVAVASSPDGRQVATATGDGRIRLWNAADGKQLFDLRGTPRINRRIAEWQQTIDREKLEQAWQKSRVASITARDKGLADLLQKAKDAIVSMNKKIPEAEKAIPPLEEARIAAEKEVAEAENARENPPEGKSPAALESELEKAKVALLAAQTKENDAIAALAAFRSNITDAEAKQKKITDTQAANAREVEEAKAAEAEAKKAETEAAAALAEARKEAAAIGTKPLAVAFSRDSARVAASFADGTIRTWAVASGQPVEQARVAEPAGSETGGDDTADAESRGGALVARSDGSFLSCLADGGVLSTTGAPVWKRERVLGGEGQPELFAGRVNAVAFSPDGKSLATGSGEPSRSGDITLFDLASGEVAAAWKERHSDCVISLDFSPDGKRLASGAADKIARITDIATGEEVGLLEGHTHYVNDVSFRSDGRVLATAGADGVVNSWDLTLGERKKKIEGWTKEVTSLQFIGATDRIVTSAGDNLVRIITDAGSQVRAISELPDFMQAAASSPDGSVIVAGGEDSYLRVWNGSDGKEIVAFGMH